METQVAHLCCAGRVQAPVCSGEFESHSVPTTTTKWIPEPLPEENHWSQPCIHFSYFHRTATCLLSKRRLQFFGNVLRVPSGHPLRDACFIPHTLTPVTEQYVRRVGRPSKEWVKETIAEASMLFGSMQQVGALGACSGIWNAALSDKFGF